MNSSSGSSEDLFRRSQDVDETRVGDRVVLYHKLDGGAFVLNPTASLLWESLSSPRTLNFLATILRDRFPSLAPERASDDVHTCLDELQSNKLVIPS